ncbi:MAG: papain-like cysteine protease family protein [Bacteroidota bacterium]
MKSVSFIIVFIIILFSQESKIIYKVPGNIPTIKQPKSYDCWVTVTTMMLSWKRDTFLTIDAVAKELGDPWDNYYRRNKGLSFDEQDDFIEQIGMRGEPPANYLIEAYIDFMRKYGPLWITTGDGFSAHARLLIAVYGDGSYEQSDFQFIDPATGKIESQNALEFVQEFEREAIVANRDNWENLRIQIYHF